MCPRERGVAGRGRRLLNEAERKEIAVAEGKSSLMEDSKRLMQRGTCPRKGRGYR